MNITDYVLASIALALFVILLMRYLNYRDRRRMITDATKRALAYQARQNQINKPHENWDEIHRRFKRK